MAHLTVAQCEAAMAWCQAHPDVADANVLNQDITIWEHAWIDQWWPHTGLGDTEPHSHHCQIILTRPGTHMPLHVDSHRRYRLMKNLTPDNSVHRMWASLTAPAVGHVMMFDDACWYNVPQGEIRSLQSMGRHVAANLGDQDRWTMVIDAVSCT